MLYSFCCLLWFFAEYSGCVLPSRRIFWAPDRCGQCRIQVKCDFRFWELTLRNVDGLGAAALREFAGGKKAGILQDLPSLLRRGTESKERTQSIVY